MEVFQPGIRSDLRFSGYLYSDHDQVDIVFLSRRYVLHVIRIVVVIQAAAAPVISWRKWDLERRVAWLQEYAFITSSITQCLNLFLSKSNAQSILSLTHPILFYTDGNKGDLPTLELSKKASDILKREDAFNYILVISARTMSNLFVYTLAVKPIFRILMHWFGLKPIDGTAMPVRSINPFVQPLTSDVSNVFHLVILSIPQLIFFYDGTRGTVQEFVCFYLSIGNLLTEMKILKCELEEMEALLELKSNIQSISVEEENVNDWRDLKRVLRRICYHHQAVFRKVEQINKVFKTPVMIVNIVIGIFTCMGLYSVMNATSLPTFITRCIMTIVGIFFCCLQGEAGQQIETEGEELRTALYNCYVVGSQRLPLWYHRTILIMLQRHDRPIRINPFQEFSLNRTTVKVLMQGTMSYFNFLNTFSR